MVKDKCLVGGCDKLAVCRGLCNKHYNRWWRQENPEKYRAIKDRQTAKSSQLYKTDPFYRRLQNKRSKANMAKGRRRAGASLTNHLHPYREWTPAEITFLVANYNSCPIVLLKCALMRSKGAIITKASRMGMSKNMVSHEKIKGIEIARVGHPATGRRCYRCNAIVIVPDTAETVQCSLCQMKYDVCRYYNGEKIIIRPLGSESDLTRKEFKAKYKDHEWNREQ